MSVDLKTWKKLQQVIDLHLDPGGFCFVFSFLFYEINEIFNLSYIIRFDGFKPKDYCVQRPISVDTYLKVGNFMYFVSLESHNLKGYPPSTANCTANFRGTSESRQLKALFIQRQSFPIPVSTLYTGFLANKQFHSTRCRASFLPQTSSAPLFPIVSGTHQAMKAPSTNASPANT